MGLTKRSKWKFVYFSDSTWNLIFRLKKIEIKVKYKQLHGLKSLGKQTFFKYTKILRHNKFFKSFRVRFERKTFFPRIFVGNIVRIHNGKEFRQFRVNKYHIGFKAGNFTLNRKPFFFPLHRKKKR